MPKIDIPVNRRSKKISRLELQRRIPVVYTFAAATITGVSWLMADTRIGQMWSYRFGNPDLLYLVAASGLILTVGSFAWTYLQTGFAKISDSDLAMSRAEDEMTANANRDNVVYVNLPENATGNSAFSEIKDRLSRLEAAHASTVDSTEENLAKLSDRLINVGADEIIERANENLEERISRYKEIVSVERSFDRTKSRLYSEVGRLGIRGNLNLALGVTISILGVSMLGYFVSQDGSSDIDVSKYVMHFLPRISLVLLVQAFALFFLKLYRNSLEEIKYYQNELTNIEQREAAIFMCLFDDDGERSDLISILAKIERNQTIASGTTTIDLEKAKIEAQGGTLEMLKVLSPMIAKMK